MDVVAEQDRCKEKSHSNYDKSNQIRTWVETLNIEAAEGNAGALAVEGVLHLEQGGRWVGDSESDSAAFSYLACIHVQHDTDNYVTTKIASDFASQEGTQSFKW